jgi:hypothetical protein
MEIARRSLTVALFTSTRRIEGIYQPIGEILTDLNTTERRCVPISNARIAPLDPGSTLRPMSLPQAIVPKEDILFFSFKDQSIVDELRLFPRPEKVVIYTPTFALRGVVHLGMEQPVQDMLDTMRGRFHPLTDVTIFPLLKTRAAAPRAQKLVLLNVDAVQLYHPDIAS